MGQHPVKQGLCEAGPLTHRHAMSLRQGTTGKEQKEQKGLDKSGVKESKSKYKSK